jgi:hypothetical protein
MEKIADKNISKVFAKNILFLGIFVLFFSIFFLPKSIFASATVGTIDPTYKYAWGENIGWINFGCQDCGVQVTDTVLTGSAWNNQYGWITLNASQSGVKNNGEGVLSGMAWAPNLGWIDFTGVTINSVGEFLGYGTVQFDSSRINFNCINGGSCGLQDFKVKTDWRPISIRTPPTPPPTPPPGGGGGHPPPVVPPIIPPVVPPVTPPVIPPIVPPVTPPAPNPTPTPGPTPTPTPGPGPTSGGGSGGGSGGNGGFISPSFIPPAIINNIIHTVGSTINTIRVITNTPVSKDIQNVSIAIPAIISTLALLSVLLSGLPVANYLFYLFVVLLQILGLKKTPKPWGTVYDSRTKRPIPFARVEILNSESRKLQSVIADENGRYGFLVSTPSATNSIIRLQSFRTKYDFPSTAIPTETEKELYPNIYKGGPIQESSGYANFDLPMDPREKSVSPGFYFGIVSITLNNIITDIANILFYVGTIMATTNIIVNPSPTTYIIFVVIILTFILRSSGFKLKPFGLTKDKTTEEAIPFGFVALHDTNGIRVNFTVSDDKGRYFLLTPKGQYLLKAYTPAHISPTRTKDMPIFTSKGWISKEIAV